MYKWLLLIIISLGVVSALTVVALLGSGNNTKINLSKESDELKIENLTWKSIEYASDHFTATISIPDIWSEAAYAGEPIERQHLLEASGPIGHPYMNVTVWLRYYKNNSTFDGWVDEHHLKEHRYPTTVTRETHNGRMFAKLTNSQGGAANIYYYTEYSEGVLEFAIDNDFIQTTELITINEQLFPSYFQLRPRIIDSLRIVES